MSTRLIQLKNTGRRRVALVEEPHLRLLDTDSIYSLAESAIRSGIRLSEAAKRSATADTLDYGPIHNGNSEWKILSPIDHRFEKENYLNLAASKLRTCALGPELVLDPDFESVPGEVTIHRNGRPLWTKQIRTGEAEMCHSLQNIEHHHFKFEAHRNPGDIHVHFLGADCLSFGEGVRLADGDVMHIKFEGFGRPLRNPVRVD